MAVTGNITKENYRFCFICQLTDTCISGILLLQSNSFWKEVMHMDWTTILWFALFVVFLIVEASCPIHLVSIWFAAGSLVALISSFFGAPLWLEAVLFLAVSCVMVALFWPFIKKFLNPKVEKTNVDAIVGIKGLVTASIDNVAAAGQVKLNGMEWTARSTSGDPIPAGTLVKVDRIEGVKAFVSPVEAKISVEC